MRQAYAVGDIEAGLHAHFNGHLGIIGLLAIGLSPEFTADGAGRTSQLPCYPTYTHVISMEQHQRDTFDWTEVLVVFGHDPTIPYLWCCTELLRLRFYNTS